MNTINTRPMKTVSIMSNNFTFISDSQDAQAIRDCIGGDSVDYDSFFVKIADGDYVEVWGMVGIIPLKSKLCSKLR